MRTEAIILVGLLSIFASQMSAQSFADFDVLKQPSCYSPCGVFVDAIEDRQNPKTNHPESSNEFHEISFSWDFVAGSGDAAADLNDGAYRYGEGGANGRTRQIGPMAAHVYEIDEGSGDHTFTIKLTARYAKGGQTDIVTKQVKVLDPSSKTTTCISQDSNVAGCPDADEVLANQGASRLAPLVEARPGNRILLEGGQTWTLTDSIKVSGNTMIGAYNLEKGKPRLHRTTMDQDSIFESSASNWTISNIEMEGPAASDGGGNKPIAIKYDNPDAFGATIHKTETVPGTFHQALSKNLGRATIVSENVWVGFGAGIWGGGNAGGNIIGAIWRDSALIGSRVGDPSGGEHTIRIFHCPESCLYSDNTLGPTRKDKATLSLRGRHQEAASLNQISRNNIRGFAGGFSRNASDQVPIGFDMLFESNYCTRDSRWCMASTKYTSRVTFRNNACKWTTAQGRCIDVSSSSSWAYNNSMYKAGGNQWTSATVTNSSDGSLRAANNLYYAPNDSKNDTACEECDVESGSTNVRVESNPWRIDDPGAIDSLEDFAPRATSVIGAGFGNYSTDPALPRLDPYGRLIDKPLNIGVSLNGRDGGGESDPVVLDAPYLY